MSVVTMPSRAARAVGGLQAALDEVEALDPEAVPWVDQELLVRELEVAQRRLDALRLRALESFVRGGGWEDEHHVSPAAWVRAELGQSRGDAGRDLALSRALREWPVVAERLRAGRISARHAAVVCSALVRLPEVDDATVESLLDLAELVDPLELTRALAARIAAAAPEQARDDADDVYERRGLHHSTTLEDMGRLDAWLEPELSELFRDALDAEACAIARPMTSELRRSAGMTRSGGSSAARSARRRHRSGTGSRCSCWCWRRRTRCWPSPVPNPP